MGNARVWAHRNEAFDMQLSYLGTCVLYLHIPSSLRAHHREWLQSDGHKMASILSFLSPNPNHEFPQGSRAHYLWWLLMTVTSLFTDMAGSIPSLRGKMGKLADGPRSP